MDVDAKSVTDGVNRQGSGKGKRLRVRSSGSSFWREIPSAFPLVRSAMSAVQILYGCGYQAPIEKGGKSKPARLIGASRPAAGGIKR